MSAAQTRKRKTNFDHAYGDKATLYRRLKTYQSKLSNHPSSEHQPGNERSHVANGAAPQEEKSGRKLAAPHDQA